MIRLTHPLVRAGSRLGPRVAARVTPELSARVGLGLALALGLTACGQDPGPAGAAAASSPSPRSPRSSEAVAPPEPWSLPRFGARRQLSLPGKPEHVVAEDLDGDGRAELICTTREPGSLHLWLGSGGARGDERGALAAEPSARAIGGWPLGPVVLPAGGFGAPAGTRLVAIASRAERTVVLHDLIGELPPREVWRGQTALDVPRALHVGDLGADGALELGVVTDQRELHLIGEAETRVRTLAGQLPTCLWFLEDGAGVVVGCQDTQSLEVHGTLDLSGPVAVLELDGIPRDVTEADIDFDGELELVAVGGDRSVWAFGRGRSGGSAAWLDPAGRGVYAWDTYTVPIDLEAPDFRGDGYGELCILHSYDLSYALSGGWGDGRPEPFDHGYAGQTPTDGTLADLDGDGRLDLAIANRDAQALSILLGDGRGHLLDATHVPVGTSPSFVITADLLGDDLPEVVTLNSKSETLSLLSNRGGVLTLAQELSEIGPSPRAPVAAQLDGTGPLELAYLVRDTSGAYLVLLAANSAGQLERVRDPLRMGTSGSDLLAVDLDLDGRAELICADADAGEVVVTSWDLGAPRRIAVPSAPRALARVEYDGDAGPEIAVALGAPGPRLGVAILDVRREEAGDPGDPGDTGAMGLVEIAFLPTEVWPIDLVEADLDGTGPLDLAVLALLQADGADGQVLPLIRRTESAPYAAYPPLTCGLRPHHISAADLNADGLDDLVVNAQNSHVINAWVARANPTRLERLNDLGAHLGPLDVTVADINGDGLLDLVVANSFSNDVSVLLGLPR